MPDYVLKFRPIKIKPDRGLLGQFVIRPVRPIKRRPSR